MYLSISRESVVLVISVKDSEDSSDIEHSMWFARGPRSHKTMFHFTPRLYCETLAALTRFKMSSHIIIKSISSRVDYKLSVTGRSEGVLPLINLKLLQFHVTMQHDALVVFTSNPILEVAYCFVLSLIMLEVLFVIFYTT